MGRPVMSQPNVRSDGAVADLDEANRAVGDLQDSSWYQ